MADSAWRLSRVSVTNQPRRTKTNPKIEIGNDSHKTIIQERLDVTFRSKSIEVKTEVKVFLHFKAQACLCYLLFLFPRRRSQIPAWPFFKPEPHRSWPLSLQLLSSWTECPIFPSMPYFNVNHQHDRSDLLLFFFFFFFLRCTVEFSKRCRWGSLDSQELFYFDLFSSYFLIGEHSVVGFCVEPVRLLKGSRDASFWQECTQLCVDVRSQTISSWV